MASEQPLRGNVILIVEDEAETLTALAHLIAEGLGCRVLTASSGDEALRVIDSGLHVDLVFTDVEMPEMDGVSLAFLIGRRLPALPVVLATGCTDVVESVTDRGGIALLKPYSIERLEALMDEHLRVDIPRPPMRRPKAASTANHSRLRRSIESPGPATTQIPRLRAGSSHAVPPYSCASDGNTCTASGEA